MNKHDMAPQQNSPTSPTNKQRPKIFDRCAWATFYVNAQSLEKYTCPICNHTFTSQIQAANHIRYYDHSKGKKQAKADVPVEFLPRNVENPVKPEGWKLPLRGRRPVGIEILESDYHESSRSNSVSYQKEARKTPNNNNNNRKRKARSRNFDSRSRKSPKYSRNVTALVRSPSKTTLRRMSSQADMRSLDLVEIEGEKLDIYEMITVDSNQQLLGLDL